MTTRIALYIIATWLIAAASCAGPSGLERVVSGDTTAVSRPSALERAAAAIAGLCRGQKAETQPPPHSRTNATSMKFHKRFPCLRLGVVRRPLLCKGSDRAPSQGKNWAVACRKNLG